MKKLELNQMESFEGGGCWSLAAGVAGMVFGANPLTITIGLFVAIDNVDSCLN